MIEALSVFTRRNISIGVTYSYLLVFFLPFLYTPQSKSKKHICDIALRILVVIQLRFSQ